MKVPLSPVLQVLAYLKDCCSHTFWDPSHLQDEEDITSKIVIVTGSNNGVGRETALQLAMRGASVIMACRNKEKAEEARNYILEKVPYGKLEYMHLDLGSLPAIRSFVRNFESRYGRLHILVNNAGGGYMDNQRRTTKDGFEYHIGANHLGPFLLTRMLLPMLKNGSPSRVVCVQSANMVLHSSTSIVEDLMIEKAYQPNVNGLLAPYTPYNHSKLAAAICIKRLSQDIQDDVKVFQLCPGLVATDGSRGSVGSGSVGSFIKRGIVNILGISPEQGCETSVYCSVHKNLKPGKGEMYRFCEKFDHANDFLEPKDEEEKEQVEILYKKSLELVLQ